MRGSSDSSSAYSGSDTMQSMQSRSSGSAGSAGSAGSGDVEEVDLTGLMESVVDSDEEVFICLLNERSYSIIQTLGII